MSKGWNGEAELAQALKELNDNHPPAASKVKAVVAIALKHPNDFKMVVFDVERWMKRSPLNDRIAGIYAMDAICRGARAHYKDKARDIYSTRFTTRLSEIFSLLNGAADADMSLLQRVIDEWLRWDIFPADKLQIAAKTIKSAALRVATVPASTAGAAYHHHSSSSRSESSGPSSSSSASSHSRTATVNTNGSSTLISSNGADESAASTAAAAMAASVNATLSTEELVDQIFRRKNIKYCPFRDSNCPYGEKCRFSHADGRVFYPTSSRRHRHLGSAMQQSYSSANSLLGDNLAAQILPVTELSDYLARKRPRLASGSRFALDGIVRLPLADERMLLEFDGEDVSTATITAMATGRDPVTFSAVLEEQFNKTFSTISSG